MIPARQLRKIREHNVDQRQRNHAPGGDGDCVPGAGNEGGWDDGGEDGESMNVGQDNEDEDSSRPRRFSSSLVQ